MTNRERTEGKRDPTSVSLQTQLAHQTTVEACPPLPYFPYLFTELGLL